MKFTIGQFVILWIQIVCAIGIIVGTPSAIRNAADILRPVTIRTVIEAMFIVAVVVGTYVLLLHLYPSLSFGIFSLFDRDYNGVNANVAATRIPIIGLLFALLLFINLPSLALFEEKTFRLGTLTWAEGMWRSLAFGLVHCLVGIPLAAGLAISILGLWCTYHYFQGGVHQAAAHHATYNMILVAVLVLATAFQAFDFIRARV